MARYGAVLDACVLVPMPLADTLLRFAEEGVFNLFWSDTILREVSGALETMGQQPRVVQRRIEFMLEAFPEAMVADIGIVSFSPGLPDPDDDHVLEAAVRSDAQAIVTVNSRHFPSHVCEKHGIDILTPDEFLIYQHGLSPQLACHVLMQQASDLHDPTVTLAELLNALRRDAPNFVDIMELELF